LHFRDGIIVLIGGTDLRSEIAGHTRHTIVDDDFPASPWDCQGARIGPLLFMGVRSDQRSMIGAVVVGEKTFCRAMGDGTCSLWKSGPDKTCCVVRGGGS
jgi:hypothetical protein